MILKNFKYMKKSQKISLMLIGLGALAGCSSSEDFQQDLKNTTVPTYKKTYRTQEECRVDWNEMCERENTGYYTGPRYYYLGSNSVETIPNNGKGAPTIWRAPTQSALYTNTTVMDAHAISKINPNASVVKSTISRASVARGGFGGRSGFAAG